MEPGRNLLGILFRLASEVHTSGDQLATRFRLNTVSPLGLAIDFVLGGSDRVSTKHDSSEVTSLEYMVMSGPL